VLAQEFVVCFASAIIGVLPTPGLAHRLRDFLGDSAHEVPEVFDELNKLVMLLMHELNKLINLLMHLSKTVLNTFAVRDQVREDLGVVLEDLGEGARK
jgi:hypothetical protein